MDSYMEVYGGIWRYIEVNGTLYGIYGALYGA